jgi:RNA methyltransferase, TrmH family
MGALFRQVVAHASWEEVDAALGDAELWGAAGAGEPVSRLRGERPRRLVLAVGNEGAGLSAEAQGRARRLVAIPIAPGVESLNAAVAAGILLYELCPWRAAESSRP